MHKIPFQDSFLLINLKYFPPFFLHSDFVLCFILFLSCPLEQSYFLFLQQRMHLYSSYLLFCFCLFAFLATPHSMQDPNSLTGDQTCTPCSGRPVLTTGLPGNSFLTPSFTENIHLMFLHTEIVSLLFLVALITSISSVLLFNERP